MTKRPLRDLQHDTEPSARSKQKVRSPPASPASDPEETAGTEHQPGPTPEVLAKEEKARKDFQAIFGRNLRAARLNAGLKQSDVAGLTGLTQQYLSTIEAGQQNITLKTMALLAEVVDHDIKDMLRETLAIPSKKR